jgi:hypothetical protein
MATCRVCMLRLWLVLAFLGPYGVCPLGHAERL